MILSEEQNVNCTLGNQKVAVSVFNMAAVLIDWLRPKVSFQSCTILSSE
jgi:hypothetical protein